MGRNPQGNSPSARTVSIQDPRWDKDVRLNLLIAAAVAELRTAARLTRTRLFVVLAVLTTLGCYFAVSGFHAMGSIEYPRAFPPPRFLISGFGSPMLWLLLAGTVFMAFDIGVSRPP